MCTTLIRIPCTNGERLWRATYTDVIVFIISVVPLQSLLQNSTILQDNIQHGKQLLEWVEDEKFGMKLCYRASVDGWRARDFHRKCDHVGPTVTLVKCRSNVFGGYTDQSWKKTGSFDSLFFIKSKCISTLFKSPRRYLMKKFWYSAQVVVRFNSYIIKLIQI